MYLTGQAKMSIQNKILIVLIILMLGVSLIFFYLIYQDKQNNKMTGIQNAESKSGQFMNQEEQIKIPEEEMRRVMAVEKEKLNEIKTERGILESVDINKIRFFIPEENKTLDLNILNIKKVLLVRQVQQQEEGLFLNEEIEFQDLPLGKKVEIKYNENDNQLLMITVLM
jgi:hypothetical protein